VQHIGTTGEIQLDSFTATVVDDHTIREQGRRAHVVERRVVQVTKSDACHITAVDNVGIETSITFMVQDQHEAFRVGGKNVLEVCLPGKLEHHDGDEFSSVGKVAKDGVGSLNDGVALVVDRMAGRGAEQAAVPRGQDIGTARVARIRGEESAKHNFLALQAQGDQFPLLAQATKIKIDAIEKGQGSTLPNGREWTRSKGGLRGKGRGVLENVGLEEVECGRRVVLVRLVADEMARPLTAVVRASGGSLLVGKSLRVPLTIGHAVFFPGLLLVDRHDGE
jgi:hypothetical protein